MKTAIETAIKAMCGKCKADLKPDEALKFTQSVLNLTHALATISNLDKK